MKGFVDFFWASHPAGGWFRKSNATGKQKKKSGKDNKFTLSPDSYPARNGSSKRDNPRYNPAP